MNREIKDTRKDTYNLLNYISHRGNEGRKEVWEADKCTPKNYYNIL